MKRFVCALLSLVLLTAAATGLASEIRLKEAGVTLTLPEGFIGMDISTEDTYAVMIAEGSREDILFGFSYSYRVEYAGRSLADLAQEELDAIGRMLSMTADMPILGEATLGDVPYLIIASTDGAELHYVNLVDGWLSEALAVKDGPLEAADLAHLAAVLEGIA